MFKVEVYQRVGEFVHRDVFSDGNLEGVFVHHLASDDFLAERFWIRNDDGFSFAGRNSLKHFCTRQYICVVGFLRFVRFFVGSRVEEDAFFAVVDVFLA